jgi:rod shape-determining protein MreC
VQGSHVNAVLAGDNSERPRLAYVSEPDKVKLGDRVVTSGEGGVFPPGLPVGVIAALDPAGPRVEPYVELSQLGYVLVVDYGLSGALPQPVPVTTRSSRRGKSIAADEARH